jgi:hypothetical protein
VKVNIIICGQCARDDRINCVDIDLSQSSRLSRKIVDFHYVRNDHRLFVQAKTAT